MSTSTPKIEARQLAVQDRLAALPRHFGRRMMVFENTVYDLMGEYCAQYKGEFWEFYELSNGGFYMAPTVGKITFTVPSNSYEAEMSADAAGITVCLFACSLLSFRYEGDATFAQHYHWLRDFALGHAETEEILSACD